MRFLAGVLPTARGTVAENTCESQGAFVCTKAFYPEGRDTGMCIYAFHGWLGFWLIDSRFTANLARKYSTFLITHAGWLVEVYPRS